jgi:hypothetical protein
VSARATQPLPHDGSDLCRWAFPDAQPEFWHRFQRLSAQQVARPHPRLWQATLTNIPSSNKTESVRKRLVRIACALITLTLGAAATKLLSIFRTPSTATRAAAEIGTYSQPGQETRVESAKGYPKTIRGAFVESDELTYNGYVVKRLHKRVKLDYPKEYKYPPQWVDASYAVLTHKGRVIAKFDDDIHAGYGNSTEFGLFPFHGGETKQLVVRKTFSEEELNGLSAYRRDFESSSVDLNLALAEKPTTWELLISTMMECMRLHYRLRTFMSFRISLQLLKYRCPRLSLDTIRKPESICKLIRLFRDVCPSDIGIGKVNMTSPNDRMGHLANIMSTVLDYILAGREREAWAFYDNAYKLPDKIEVQTRIRAILRRHPVYRFIYGKDARPGRL